MLLLYLSAALETYLCVFWQMPIGRNCVDHYRQLSRYCVFSHDEMVCNMACKADTMDVDLASVLQKEMMLMLQEEEQLRQKIKKMVSSCCLKGLLFLLVYQSKGLNWWHRIVSVQKTSFKNTF